MPDLAPILAPALAGGGSSLQELLLSQLDTSDPTTALLVQFMANQSQGDSKSSDDDDEDDESPRQRLRKLSSAFRQLRNKHESLQAEVKEFQMRNDTLAAALGACYLCWGEYSNCDICQGNGSAGYFPIEMQAFSEMVLPAVRALKKQQQPPIVNGTNN